MKAWAVCAGRKIERGGELTDLLLYTNKRDAESHLQPGERVRRVAIVVLPDKLPPFMTAGQEAALMRRAEKTIKQAILAR